MGSTALTANKKKNYAFRLKSNHVKMNEYERPAAPCNSATKSSLALLGA